MTDAPSPEKDRAFDWQEVHRRLAVVESSLAQVDATSPEAMERIWARRAARLARVPAEEDAGEQITLVLACLGREFYGLEAQYVLDIRPLGRVTRVPRAPHWVTGVVNLRGRILSVMDIRRFLGLPSAGCNEEEAMAPSLVVVETPSMEIALLVDDVLAVETLSARRLQEATGVIQSLPPEYVRGVVERGDPANGSMLTVLDMPALLADERLIVDEEIS